MNRAQQQVGKHRGGYIGPRNRDPEDEGEQQDHKGKPQMPAGDKAIDGAVQVEAWLAIGAGDGAVGDTGGIGIDGFHQLFVEICANLPAQIGCCPQNVFAS